MMETLYITLSESLVTLGADKKIQTLISSMEWGSFYPNSSALSHDEKKLYIGMRQFVGEFDIETCKFRYLIPSKEFLNKLSKEDEDRVRSWHKK